MMFNERVFLGESRTKHIKTNIRLIHKLNLFDTRSIKMGTYIETANDKAPNMMPFVHFA